MTRSDYLVISGVLVTSGGLSLCWLPLGVVWFGLCLTALGLYGVYADAFDDDAEGAE